MAIHFIIIIVYDLQNALPVIDGLDEIDPTRLVFDGTLHKGCFFETHKGRMDKKVPVAVKIVITGMYACYHNEMNCVYCMCLVGQSVNPAKLSFEVS